MTPTREGIGLALGREDLDWHIGLGRECLREHLGEERMSVDDQHGISSAARIINACDVGADAVARLALRIWSSDSRG